MELLFKPASIDDIEAIYLLCKDLIDKYEDKSVIDYQKVLLWVKNKIEKRISRRCCFFDDIGGGADIGNLCVVCI